MDAAEAESGVHNISDAFNSFKGADVNMEAPITLDDLIQAGGLGATDDISSIVPCAVDSTDFEASLISAREYEESQSSACNLQGNGDINMEATIVSDDLIRAGGFGATDDMGSFLPVAVDSTDFEASLRDARDYEEPQGDVPKRGLGWQEAPASSD